MKSDIEELTRLINIPDGTISSEWQTGNFPSESDWWLAATLILKPETLELILKAPTFSTFIETPPGLILDSSFKKILELNSAIKSDKDIVSITTTTYSIAPFIKSPLINGHMIQLADEEILVMLSTL